VFSYKLIIIVAVPYVPASRVLWHIVYRLRATCRDLSAGGLRHVGDRYSPRHQEREIKHRQGNVDDGFLAWGLKHVGVHQAP
jgi:hypothetical protein